MLDILARHQHFLEALYERQRDQHPLISSIADIELDAALQISGEYEAYIKVRCSRASQLQFSMCFRTSIAFPTYQLQNSNRCA